MSAPTVSVIVPTYRRPDALDATLARLDALDYPRDFVQVIVVDDGSHDATPEVAAGHTGVTFVQQENRGAASARNLGARQASGELIMFIDDDILVEPTHVNQHLSIHSRYDRALVNGEWEFAPATVAALQMTPFGRYRLALEKEFRRSAPVELFEDGCLRCEVIPSQDLSMSRELFWEIGGFDEDFPAAGAEDQEFSYRARDAGCLLLRDRSIRLLHNDARVTFEQFCLREERSARTVPYLARRYPDAAAAISYARLNGPLHRSDRPAIAVSKVAKSLLVHEPVLKAARWTIGLLERLRTPDRVLARAYSAIASLYIFRGFRRSLTS